EGPRTTIDRVTISGSTHFKAKELRAYVGGPTSSAFGLGALYFVEVEANRALSSIESLYYHSGFLDVRIEGPEPTFSADRKEVQLTLHVSEGTRYLVQEITVENQDPDHAQALEEVFARYRSKPFYPRITREIQSVCSGYLANTGYADASVQALEAIDAQTGLVSIQLQVQLGPIVHIDSIEVSGNRKTRTGFILGALELKPGDRYSQAAERRSFQSLYASGLFSSVRMKLSGAGTQRTLEIEVQEAPTLSTSVEVGYGAFERSRIILGLSERSIFGTGRSLTLEAKLAEKARGAELFFSDPYTIDSDHVLGATAFIEEREQVSFDQQELGLGVNLQHTLTRNYRQIYGHEYRISEASNSEIVIPSATTDLQNDVRISALYITNVYDTRDTFFLPREGSRLRFRSEIAGAGLGSELSFMRFDGRFSHYVPFENDQQLAFAIRGGLIVPTEGTQFIPLQERFFNGGQDTVRSFREDELGPTDANGNPIGGEVYSVFSLEYRRTLFGTFSAALFADAGNVELAHTDFLKLKDLRYGVGPGVRWLLPIGPLRLDWGINPKPRPGEEEWVLQFSLGVAF
ncbi:MAG: outer membrane protein insertion porin family, partial [Candidatus Paceibacteria bacterium]